MQSITIKEIEKLTENDVLTMDHELLQINDHKVYLVDLEGYFGFSALVFRNGCHIYYANDYELHHKYMSRPELITWYKETMNNKLYSDDMIKEPIKDYHDGEAKDYYLRNYYPMMCIDRISAFHIFHNDEEEREFEKSIEGMLFSKIGFFYTNDRTFCEKLNKLYILAQKSKEGSLDNYDYWLSAFKYEMFNHEYAINWTPDTDTISAFCNIPRDVAFAFNDTDQYTLDDLMDIVKFSDIQKKAYKAARVYVLKNSVY